MFITIRPATGVDAEAMSRILCASIRELCEPDHGGSADVVARWIANKTPEHLPLEPDAAHLFFQLVSRRYERGAMMITSNRSVGEWGTVFGDPVVATAILDRLLHHSHIVTVRGDSFRLREKRRSGLITKPTPQTKIATSA